jgi:hypothetical protein
MELFLVLPVIISKNFFNKSLSIWSDDSKIVLETGNGIIYTGNGIIYTGYRIITFTSRRLIKKLEQKIPPLGLTIQKWFSTTGNGII